MKKKEKQEKLETFFEIVNNSFYQNLQGIINSLNSIRHVLIVQFEQWHSNNKHLPYRQSKENGQYGYYVYSSLFTLFMFIYTNKIKKVLDLGSGAGIILETLRFVMCNNMTHKCSFNGIEIEEGFVAYSKDRFPKINNKVGDITKLSATDFEDVDLIYFWEPFMDDDKSSKAMIECIVKYAKVGTYIYYVRATNGVGNIINNYYSDKLVKITTGCKKTLVGITIYQVV